MTETQRYCQSRLKSSSRVSTDRLRLGVTLRLIQSYSVLASEGTDTAQTGYTRGRDPYLTQVFLLLYRRFSYWGSPNRKTQWLPESYKS